MLPMIVTLLFASRYNSDDVSCVELSIYCILYELAICLTICLTLWYGIVRLSRTDNDQIPTSVVDYRKIKINVRKR